MRLRALSLLLAAAALSGVASASAHAAFAYRSCAETRGRLDSQSCYYASSRQCWVTETGIGVCVPVPSVRRPKAASSK